MSMQKSHEGEKQLLSINIKESKEYEQEEESKFKTRAKLYRFEKKENKWKERGVGDIQIFQHKTSKRCRVLMRREQTFKVCANHYPATYVKFKQNEGNTKSWIYNVIDYSDGTAKDEILFIRFLKEESANKFKKVFEECVAINENLPKTGEKTEEKTKEETDEKEEEKKEKEEEKKEKEEEKPKEKTEEETEEETKKEKTEETIKEKTEEETKKEKEEKTGKTEEKTKEKTEEK
ncbi:e3 sumo-protein ligase ranbp2-related [Anaeramoeba flamelloides]|uniref:E3 sumo-protein ligase ranbp2-related n=1 Tax=Anaeramoeba flamelloides TaxID=1746091 RepID=A0ABQ8Z7F5_9EUKA|nr:e3 sumo-protein ligase ranbp2-related [Anaeramoeba flamelloides]